MTGIDGADVEALVAGVLAGDRAIIGRAITLVESSADEDVGRARELLAALLPHASRSHRIGVTGSPGVGKSTFIEALGKHLTAAGHRVAVLAVDPSSTRSGGSILGDKTRMQELARDPNAFIRPSPSGGELGGVARRTRQAIPVLEAAGHDVVLVETVGVGQSETTVANMVDTFVVLLLPGSGDSLQGIKRGILELVDLLTITKADGDNVSAASRAKGDYELALRMLTPRGASWTPEVSSCSALTGDGIAGLWERICAHRAAVEGAGEWEERRRDQRRHWMWRALEHALLGRLRSSEAIAAALPGVEGRVEAGEITPDDGAAELLSALEQAGPA